MTISLPQGLPAAGILREEGLPVAGESSPPTWQPRPLEIALLNLMPNKQATELQFARLLAAAPFDVALTLIVPDGRAQTGTSTDHISRFYRPWSSVRLRHFDGLIMTGAPLETKPCREVSYWRQMERILDWTRDHVRRSCYICWGAMAALYHFHGIVTPVLPNKRFGVFEQKVRDPASRYLKGFGSSFVVPVSRRAELAPAALPSGEEIRLLADSRESGVCLLAEPARGALYMFNHLEYAPDTLRAEYERDRSAGQPVPVPVNYFPDDDPQAAPADPWRPFAQLLFTNWLTEVSEAALPSEVSQRALEWLLAEPLASKGYRNCADFLIAAEPSPCLLPQILARVEDAGYRALAAKLHQRAGRSALVELRVADISAADAERLSCALLKTAGVRRVAHRCSGSASGRAGSADCCYRSVRRSVLHDNAAPLRAMEVQARAAVN